MLTASPQIHAPTDEPVDQSILENEAQSVGHLFRDRVGATPDRPAYMYAVVSESGDEWVTVTWSELDEVVREVGAGLIALGVESEDRVAIASSTRYEWALADLAIMVRRGATTTIYPTTIADDVAFIIADSGAKVVFAEDSEQLEKLRAHRERAAVGDARRRVRRQCPTATAWTLTLDEVRSWAASTSRADPAAIDARIDAHPARPARDDHLHLGHHRPAQGRPAAARRLDLRGRRRRRDRHPRRGRPAVPLAAAGPRVRQGAAHPAAADRLPHGRSTGGSTRSSTTSPSCKPTFMGAAPRIFEKAYGRIMTMMEDEGGVKAEAVRLGHRRRPRGQRAARAGQGPDRPAGPQVRASPTSSSFTKIRDRFGGRDPLLHLRLGGAQPRHRPVVRRHGHADPRGLRPDRDQRRLVRQPPRGLPLRHRRLARCPAPRCSIAEDGEVLLRGPGVMEGYHNNPEATAEAIDADGWLHTGDIGELDDRGFLRITDRKKDLFKTSGGKYVAPSIIESTFKGLCPYASQLVVHGADRNFVSALVTLDPEAIQGWAAQQRHGGRVLRARSSRSDACREMVQGYIDQLNAGLNRWETIKKFTILDHDLTIEAGELTPSLKLKRKVVADKYKERLDAHYSA